MKTNSAFLYKKLHGFKKEALNSETNVCLSTHLGKYSVSCTYSSEIQERFPPGHLLTDWVITINF